MPRSRTRQTMHHDPQYYRIRNHLVDFLVHRSKNYGGDGPAAAAHDPMNPPLVRPGLDECATVTPLPLDRVRPTLAAVNG